MSDDPKECREHAKRCRALATMTANPVLKESLREAAQRWRRLALILELKTILRDQNPRGRRTFSSACSSEVGT